LLSQVLSSSVSNSRRRSRCRFMSAARTLSRKSLVLHGLNR
jgi:hypothetical protein